MAQLLIRHTKKLKYWRFKCWWKEFSIKHEVFVKQVEGERNPLEIFTYKNLASFLEIADAQLDLDSYVNLPVKNLKRADGSDLVAGEWNDVLIPFSVGTKKSILIRRRLHGLDYVLQDYQRILDISH